MSDCVFTLRFLDSFNFLCSSLSKLTDNLKNKTDILIKESDKIEVYHQYFKNTYNNFRVKHPELSINCFQLLLRKGVYITDLEILNEKELLKEKDFYDNLNMKEISASDYQHAKEVWDLFSCSTLLDYHTLYMELDGSLLADIFENFRTQCLYVYGLDPVYFMTAPSLSWEACLKKSKVKLQIITDPDINLFIDSAMIGGVSIARNPYLKANNEMVLDYDETKEKTWLINVDCNNQYGYSMSKYLPTGDFRWVEDPSKFMKEYILDLKEDGSSGFYLEVDLEYPKHLHEEHDQYPLAPEHYTIKSSDLSEEQIKLSADLNIKIGKQTKLCLTLKRKLKYKLHYTNLQQCLKLGLVLTAVHRVLVFRQSPWMKPYIDLNTRIRQQAICKADEVNFFDYSLV